jgi:hypothetical protein
MAERRFTEAEALALVGKHIRNNRKWGYVPKGTTGVVMRAEPSWGKLEWLLSIRWDLPGRPEPLSDWVSASEYGRWVKEL